MNESSPPPRSTEQRAYAAVEREQDQRAFKRALYVASITIPASLGIAIIAPDVVANRFGILVTALATGVVAWFTWQLKRSTDRLWSASNDQIRLARSEFLATHRPELVIRSFLFTELPDSADDTTLTTKYRMTFWIVNKGRSPATLISARFQTFFGLTTLIPGRNELLSNPLAPWSDGTTTIEPGGHLRHDVSGIASSVRLAAMDRGMDNTDVYFLGRIVYADREGTRHEIGFGRQHTIKAGATTILTDPAIEYSD